MKEFYKLLNSMKKEEMLRALGLIFNDQGIRDILDYYTIGSMDDIDDEDNEEELAGYMKQMKLAKKLKK